MNHMRYIVLALVLALSAGPVWGQVDKKEVRHGNRDFRKEKYEMAFQDYLRAVEKDTLSVAANYNMANALYRMEQYDQAQQALDRIGDAVLSSASAADYFFNLGDVALQKKDYQAAVKAFTESLILRPEDLQAKENLIYARQMLQNQQNQENGGGQNDDQQDNQDQNQDNQDQNKNNDQQNDQNQNDQNQDNQDQNGDQDKNDDQQNDQNQDQNDDQQGDQNDKPQDQQGQPQQQEAQISPQAAQQMLQAIQAKEKETQDKVNKKKAMALKSRQKEKNW